MQQKRQKLCDSCTLPRCCVGKALPSIVLIATFQFSVSAYQQVNALPLCSICQPGQQWKILLQQMQPLLTGVFCRVADLHATRMLWGLLVWQTTHVRILFTAAPAAVSCMFGMLSKFGLLVWWPLVLKLQEARWRRDFYSCESIDLGVWVLGILQVCQHKIALSFEVLPIMCQCACCLFCTSDLKFVALWFMS